jgi:YfiH family protein
MIQKAKGLFFEDDKIEIFFGNKFYALTDLTSLKPTGVHTVKQTHSDIFHVVTRPEPVHPQPEGDALGTNVPKQYLAIKTADCLPVMIHDSDNNRVAAIHAGWKGVAIGIVPKTVKQYFENSKTLRLFIGPHIMKESFEIKNDVLEQLKNSLPTNTWPKVDIETKGDKFHIDLTEIVEFQIKSQFPNIQFTVEKANIDTKITEDYNSFRRDSTNAGRNISYIRLK